MPSVSVCFPAYNEEASIERVLNEARELMSSSGLEYEILVCDDGSSDQTGVIVERAARFPNVRVLHNPQNMGIRATFERLYNEASKDFVFLNSTDGQWETSVLFEMLPLTREFDIVIAARREKHYGLIRTFVSWGFNLLPRILFGVETHDAGAVKLVRREIITRFSLVSRSPFSEAERLIRAARAGYRIASHPVQTSDRRAGQARGVTLSSVTEAMKDVARVWWALRGGSRDSHRAVPYPRP
ncbi:MAG: glycosyltransferase family 2 protein [Blastocatellia bacterium]